MQAKRLWRKLGLTEKYIYLIDRVCSFNFVMQANIDGDLKQDILRLALDLVQKRHPLLQMRIRKKSWTTLCFEICKKQIPLRVVDATDEVWINEVENELHKPLPAERGPLLRCVLFRNCNIRTMMLLTFHHSIGDAMSGVYLIRDLIETSGRLIRGENVRLTELPLKDPMESYHPGSVRGVSGFFKTVGFFARSLYNTARWKNPVLPHIDKKVPLSERRAIIVNREISQEQMKRLIAGARDHHTTIQGVLAAACTLAILCERQKGKQETVMVSSDVNLREILVPPVKDEIGFFISCVTTIEKSGQETDFWELAGTLRGALKSCFAREEPLFFSKIIALSDLFLRLAGTGRFASRLYAFNTEWTTPEIFELSNIGALDIEHHYAPLSIKRIGFAASFSATATLGLHTSTLNGCMVCNFVGMAPLYSREHIESIADRVIGILSEVWNCP